MDLINTHEELWAALPRELKGCVGWYLQWRSLCIRRLDKSEVRVPVHVTRLRCCDVYWLERLCAMVWNVDPIDQRWVMHGKQIDRTYSGYPLTKLG